MLERLADGDDDLTQIAFVERPPGSGFLGSKTTGASSARLVRNDPEHLRIEVEAPARGFLVLADQDYAGWHATVNGTPAPILRANYLFRLVEVPAGTSTVEFIYRPASLIVGAAISSLAIAISLILLVGGRSRR